MNFFAAFTDISYVVNTVSQYLNKIDGSALADLDHAQKISPILKKIDDQTIGIGTLEGNIPIWQEMIEALQISSNLKGNEKDRYLTCLSSWVITGISPVVDVEMGDTIATVKKCAVVSLFCIKLICMIENEAIRKRLWQSVALRLSIMQSIEPGIFSCFRNDLFKLFDLLNVQEKETLIDLNVKTDYQEECGFKESLNEPLEFLDKDLRSTYFEIGCSTEILKSCCDLHLEFPGKLLEMDAKTNKLVIKLLCFRKLNISFKKIPKPVLCLILADLLLEPKYCTDKKVAYLANKLNVLMSSQHQKKSEFFDLQIFQLN